MSKQNKKKIGYKQYEHLLSLAHQKIELLAEKFHELQTYFIAYVEYRGHNVEFNDWMNKRIKTLQAEVNEAKEKEEHANEEV
jgi:hypothetical protein